MEAAWVTHLIGAIGVVTSTVLSYSPYKAVMQARADGCLGGLDTRLYPQYYYMNQLWVGYAILLADPWVFLSAVVPAGMWLFFSVSAVRLLSQEEGELQQTLTEQGKSAWDAPTLRTSTVAMHQTSKDYRLRQILVTERALFVVYMFTGFLAFVLLPDSVVGLESLYEKVLTKKVRLAVYENLCLISCLIGFSTPLFRIWALIKRRDASTVYLPFCCAQGLHNLVWVAFGIQKGLYSVYVPNGAGLFTVVLQLFLKLLFHFCPGKSSSSDAHTPVVPISMTSGAASPEDLKRGPADLEAAVGEEGTAPSLMNQGGVYEEYLVWQREYKQLRRSCTVPEKGRASVASEN